MAESPTDLPRGYQYPEGNVRADPSALTVAMLDKAIGQVREFYDAQLKELRDGLKTAHDDYVRVPTLLDRAIADTKILYDAKIAGLKELLETEIEAAAGIRHGQFERVDAQFEALALRARDLDEARATALSAALAAAKELVGAANTNFTKQIDGLRTDFTGQIKALDEKVNDLRDRITQISGIAQGGVEARTLRRADTGSNSAIISALIAAIVAAVTIGTVMLTRQAPPTYVPPPVAVPSR